MSQKRTLQILPGLAMGRRNQYAHEFLTTVREHDVVRCRPAESPQDSAGFVLTTGASMRPASATQPDDNPIREAREQRGTRQGDDPRKQHFHHRRPFRLAGDNPNPEERADTHVRGADW